MITTPGLYVQNKPLRVVAVAISPTGQLAALEYQLTPEQAAGFAMGLADAVTQECQRIDEFDRQFLAAANIFEEEVLN